MKNTWIARQWWRTLLIPALEKQREHSSEFKASLGYTEKLVLAGEGEDTWILLDELPVIKNKKLRGSRASDPGVAFNSWLLPGLQGPLHHHHMWLTLRNHFCVHCTVRIFHFYAKCLLPKPKELKTTKSREWGAHMQLFRKHFTA